MFVQYFHLNQKRECGFTLIEVLMVLVVSAIILGLAAPSFMNIIANNRVASAANDMVVALNLAKSEAVKTGQTTAICASNNGTDCTANWSDGWLLYVEEGGNVGRIIRVHEPTHPSLNFNFYISNIVDPGPIRFKPNGNIVLKPNTEPQPIGRFCFRNAHNEANSRAVDITAGRHIQNNVFDLTLNNC